MAMETVNNEQKVKNRMNNKYIRSALFLIFFNTWIYKLFEMLIQFNFTIIFDHFLYAYRLWRPNIIFITPITLICLLGIPKFATVLGRCFSIVIKSLKSFIKTSNLIDVPIYVFLFPIFLKIYPLLPTLNGKYIQCIKHTIIEKSFLEMIQKDWMHYQFFYLTSLILLLFGIYTIITHYLVRRWSKIILKISLKLMTKLYLFLSVSISTPLSWLILLFLKMNFELYPYIIMRSYEFVVNHTFILMVIAFACAYKIYQWFHPDPNYEIDFSDDIYLDDVSKMNKTRISSIFYPRTINDIQYLIGKARLENKTISVRGQAHTMGGQTLPSRKRPSRNYVCDLKYMNHVEYDSENKEVLVQAGATWAHVIHKLNLYGRSPVVMQSYCSFSVAGTISVNAHGITSDDAMHNSVISIEYIDINGKEQECSREKNQEIFSLIIGGYGLFAIITRLRLMTVPNIKTTLEYIRLQVSTFNNIFCDNFTTRFLLNKSIVQQEKNFI